MMMISSRKTHDEYVAAIKLGLVNTTITMDRLNDAVARIISVKLALGVAKQKQKLNVRTPSQIHIEAEKRLLQVEAATT